MKLENLPPVYEAYSADYPDLTVCRVVLQEKDLYHVIHKDGMMQAQVSGKFRYDTKTVSDFPAVGDYVMADITGGDRAVIHNVLPRTSVFIRKAAGKSNTEQVVAANIDTVFLCMSLNNDFNIRRIERYMTAAWDSGAVPVVLLTKTDLCDEVDAKIAQIESVAVGVDIITTSVAEPDGYSQITPYLKAGKTLAFVGSSGTGLIRMDYVTMTRADIPLLTVNCLCFQAALWSLIRLVCVKWECGTAVKDFRLHLKISRNFQQSAVSRTVLTNLNLDVQYRLLSKMVNFQRSGCHLMKS